MFLLRFTAIIIMCLFGARFCNAAINISCVGDSITAGVGVSSPTVESYPARLQKLLGTNYTVGNFGLSGATLLKQGDTPYWGSTAYLNSHGRSAALAPSIVVIMLGSNDSKPQNWAYGTNFVSNYLELIAGYATNHLSPNPRMLICTPPPCFGNNAPGINPGIVATNISSLIRELGTNFNFQVIDFQSLLAGHNEWFPDNVHPNLQGATVMAAIVYTALQGDTLNGSIPNLAIKALTNNNVVLNWPAGGAGWVLQSTPAPVGANAWIIAANALYLGNDGTSLYFTNSISGTNALFRLWNPSTNN
jgi:acyl-CoA thioesterase I